MAAILGAEIQGGGGSDLTAVEDSAEFIGVIFGEEHVVMREVEAAGRRPDAPGDGRQAALAGRGRRGTQAGQRGHVAVEQHGVGGDLLAARQFHAGGAAALGCDARHIGVEAEGRALAFGQAAQRIGHRAHAAPHQPHPLLLDMGHQHQRGRGEPGRGADISGVAAEKLAQPGVGEMVAQRRPHAAERRGPPQRQGAGTAHQLERRGALAGDERLFQRAVDGAGAGAEIAVALCIAGAGEVADRVGRAVDVGEQVEPAAGAPGVPGQCIGRVDG